MAQKDHRLMSTPVSVNDGLKRADHRTWVVIGGTAIAALVIVIAINLFFTKPKIVWPASPAAPLATPGPDQKTEEPRTYDVAPPQKSKKDN